MKKNIYFLVLTATILIFSPNKAFSDKNSSPGELRSCLVTVNVTLSTGLEPTGTIVTCNGIVDTITSSNGTIVFDIGTPGPGVITAFKIGYDSYNIDNIDIECNHSYNIALSEKKYPPTCLEVDPVTLKATWCEPLRTALDEDFENPNFPPAGWQATSHGEGWYRTNDGNNGNWTIPAWDSYYAVTNSFGNGCCDYLITPGVDLRESEGYTLSFSSFYDGGFGELAFVEYSLDGCITWEILCQLYPAVEWTGQELNLSAFSGPDGPEQIWFAFHADDAGAWASGWAVDNVKIQVPDPAANYIDFWVYLNDTLVGVTTQTNWDYAPLLYGPTYTASVAARYSSGLSSKDYYTFSSKYLFPPDSLTGIIPDDAAILQWYPPWEYWPPIISNVNPVDLEESYCPPPNSGQLPENLLGYNIYRDGIFVAYTPHTPPGEYVPQGYVDEDLWPGFYEYTVTAVYDLAPYGYPGDTAESMPEGPAEVIGGSCFDMEFLETWSMGTFEDNNWIAESANWSVDNQVGNPSPAAKFSGYPVITDYDASLMSYPICAVGMTEGKIWLDFDLKLDVSEPTGQELLQVQVWNWEQEEWAIVAQYSDSAGSFEWISEHINIKSQAMDKIFRIRFHAIGANSASILGWFIDNIDVYRSCDGPTNLQAFVIDGEGIGLSWDREIGGYNVYCSIGGAEYVLIEFITEPFFEEAEDLIPGTMYCYMVTAVWTSETDQCESDFSNEACVFWTGIDDKDMTINSLNLYPNPADEYVYITASGDLKRVTVYNELGQLVIDQITTGKQYELTTTSYTIGVYLVRVETAAGVTTRTLTIRR
jgi:hypothetical protein